MIRNKQLINDLAQDVLKAYNISIPIENIDEAVQRMGGIIKSTESMPYYIEGKIQKNSDGKGFIIYVSEFQSEAQRRFTIAHELGHLFIHMGYIINPEIWEANDGMTFYRNRDNSEMEYQANEFAAAFLMPEDEYRKVMDKFTVDNLVETAKIADYFGVSVSAASNRGKFLGLLEW